MIILGIDPGVERVGYGILEIESPKKRTVLGAAWGCIVTSRKDSHGKRLAAIHDSLEKLIKKTKPAVAGVEKLFFFKNMKTVMAVSEARGVIVLALEQAHVPIFEMTPLQVKQTLTNYGRAEKHQIQMMVKATLKLKTTPKPDDAADALAVALSTLYHLPR